MLDINKIYLGDCLEVMKNINDKSIDMILCDLPYGSTNNKWDNAVPCDFLWIHYERIIKDNGAIVLTASSPFDKLLACSNLKLYKYNWIWQKDRGTGHLNAKKRPLVNFEEVLIFYKKQPVYNPQMYIGKECHSVGKAKGLSQRQHSVNTNYNEFIKVQTTGNLKYPKSILYFQRDKEKLHPTQKPVALFEYMIKTYTNEHDLVLDSCCGSGTTGIACINTNRNYILIEKDKNYFDISVNRVQKII
ncbi:MAG: DNA-methyltransferase [Syntrophothermus sp.]